MATKHVLDPALEQDDDEYMAVWRDSDVSRQPHTDLKRSAGLTCGSTNSNSTPNSTIHLP